MTTFAFPSGHNPQRGRQEDGMTLRDYFAAKAMQAIITRCDEKSSEFAHVDSWVGSYAYLVADAMMEARK